MLVVNLYAGPCVGKTTLAADIFTKLKRAGVQAENPPEVAKIRAQRGDLAFLEDQLAVFAENQHQLGMTARSGATVAIVDSPLLLSLVYAPRPYLRSFPALVREVYDRYENLNFVLRRQPGLPYSMVGRVHTEAEAHAVDAEVVQLLQSQRQPFHLIDSSEESAQKVVAEVLRTLGHGAAPEVQPRRRTLRAA